MYSMDGKNKEYFIVKFVSDIFMKDYRIFGFSFKNVYKLVLVM